jgi:hypothetical protein
MLHKNVPTSFHSLPVANPSTPNPNRTGLSLVSPGSSGAAALDRQAPPRPSSLLDLVVITSRRCSAFFAEAAVLVLVFGILDYFMLKGRVELPWIVGALAISLGLLAASIAMDFGAHRWIKAHP